MAEPSIAAITPANAWVKVATNVTTGFVHVLTGSPINYVHTYRTTGGAAPDPVANLNEAVSFKKVTEEISASVAIDVYVMNTKEVGSVRVDV